MLEIERGVDAAYLADAAPCRCTRAPSCTSSLPAVCGSMPLFELRSLSLMICLRCGSSDLNGNPLASCSPKFTGNTDDDVPATVHAARSTMARQTFGRSLCMSESRADCRDIKLQDHESWSVCMPVSIANQNFLTLRRGKVLQVCGWVSRTG